MDLCIFDLWTFDLLIVDLLIVDLYTIDLWTFKRFDITKRSNFEAVHRAEMLAVKCPAIK